MLRSFSMRESVILHILSGIRKKQMLLGLHIELLIVDYQMSHVSL